MKFNPVYKCPLCDTIVQISDIIIDVSEEEIKKEKTWMDLFHGTDNNLLSKYDITYISHQCESGSVGYAHFSGFIPIEEPGE